MGRGLLTCLLCLAALTLAAPAAFAFDPATEAQNFGKGNERSAIYNTAKYRQLLTQVSAENRLEATGLQAADPERNFMAQLCATGEDGCAGDARLYRWDSGGYGFVQKVLFTARNGATISGRVWMTNKGAAKRPGIVITNGSVQAPERVYWFVAQTLAKEGYVVLTWDPQGQGQSDTQGEAPDQNEGVPAQSDGRPFFDGTEDAINFFFSTPSNPYEPIKSCNSGTSHAPKQNRRAKAGLNAPNNPFWSFLDQSRVGIAGHSYGAGGVSYIGQQDPRVKAIVAWDNLGAADPNAGLGEEPCPANPALRAPAAITKPALGMSADYFIPPTPNTSDPDPLAKSTQSRAYSSKGVDSGEIIIRGGTHYDFDWVPNQGFPATLRGADEIAWYTTAWFDKYVKGDTTADRRLTTSRWRSDAQEGAVDPNHDANMFSFYYRSRLNIGLAGGGRFVCENMRPGCPGMTANDGYPGVYDFYKIVTTRDAPGKTPAGSGIYGCGRKAGRTIRLHFKHKRVVRATIYINRKRVRRYRGHNIRRIVIPAAGTARHKVKVVLRLNRGRRHVSVRTYRGCRKTHPRRIKSRAHRHRHRHGHRR
jgi:dienelactone hydrolase